MSFIRYNENGEPRRNRTVLDCSGDDIIVEQNHKQEVDINNIIRRHGIDMIAKTAAMSQPQYIMDENPNNDFQEAMLIVAKARESFESMPSHIRKRFSNSPAEYLDFVQNPQNKDELIKLGLATEPPKPADPIEVRVINPETPPAPAEAG